MNILLPCALALIFAGFLVFLLARVDVARGKKASLPTSTGRIGIQMMAWGAILTVFCAVAIYLGV